MALALVACLTLAGCAAASTPSPSPSASASFEGDEVIAAFLAMVKAPEFTTETEMSGSMTSSGIRIRVDATGRLVGHDAEMTMTLSQGRVSIDLEVILVGDFAYVREPDGEWEKVDRDLVNTSGAQLDSFEFITEPTDLRYKGTDTRDGEKVHVLVNAGAIRYLGAADTSGKVGLLRILVREDGTPLFLSYRVEATTQDLSGSPIRAVGDIEQTFSNVGSPVTIQAPPGF
jgi:hypothetical protein